MRAKARLPPYKHLKPVFCGKIGKMSQNLSKNIIKFFIKKYFFTPVISLTHTHSHAHTPHTHTRTHTHTHTHTSTCIHTHIHTHTHTHNVYVYACCYPQALPRARPGEEKAPEKIAHKVHTDARMEGKNTRAACFPVLCSICPICVCIYICVYVDIYMCVCIAPTKKLTI